MKRIALLTALASASLSVMLYIFGVKAVYPVTVFFFLTAAVVLGFKKKIQKALTISAALLIVAAFGVYLCFFQTLSVDKTKELTGKSGMITCLVREEPEYRGEYVALPVRTLSDKAKNSDLCGSVNLVLYPNVNEETATAEVGDEITAFVTFGELREGSERYRYSDRVYVSAICDDAEITGHKHTLYETAVKIRQAVRNKINQNFSGNSRAILNGIVLGDNSAMSDELYNAFKICGTLHVTAVSGMHIGALCSAIISLFMLFMKNRNAYLAALFPTFLIVAVTGFYPSGIRAGFMCAVTFLGLAFLKKGDGLNSLGVSALLMLIINPFYVCDLGFGLSCTATAGVIVATDFYNKRVESRIKIRNKWIRIPVQTATLLFLQSIGAAIFTLPLQIFEFGFVSVIVPISSVLLSSAVVYILIITVIGITVSFVPFIGEISSAIFLLPKLFIRFVEVVTLSLARLPFSYLSFGAFWVVLWLGMTLMFIGIWHLVGKYGGKRLLSVAIAGLFAVSLIASSVSSKGFVEISSINFEKGYSVVIYSGEKCVIIGGGSDKSDAQKILGDLRLHGVKTVDAVLLPTDSENVAGGVYDLCSYLSVSGSSVTKQEGEVYHTLENVKIYAHPYNDGCYYEVTVYDKTVIIGAGAYKADVECDVLFSTRALPEILSSDITVIQGLGIRGDLNRYGRIYCNESENVSIRFGRKEVSVYGR